MTDSPSSRTRWLIALAVVLLMAAMGWVVVSPAYKRFKVVQEIEQVGGRVDRERFQPPWLRPSGIEFQRVNWVDLDGTEFNDVGMQHLSSLRNLRYLYMNNTKISDDGLKHLSPSDES